MYNAMQMFKIIFSIIAAILILIFLINFAGNYSGVQSETLKSRSIKNFIKVVDDVHLSGNPTEFHEFKKSEAMINFNPRDEKITGESVIGSFNIYTPLLVSPGDELILNRIDYDYGWWKFYLVEALPKMTIVFTLEDNSPEARTLMRDLTNSFPSTLYFNPPILFDYCSGDELLGADFCISSVTTQCHRNYFLNSIADISNVSFQKCTASLNEFHRLITISNSCSTTYTKGLCIKRGDKAYFNGEAYNYDSRGARTVNTPNAATLDLLPLIIGWDKTDVLGNVYADNLYDYMDRKFVEQAKLAAELGSKRMDILISTSTSRCIGLYNSMKSDLNQMLANEISKKEQMIEKLEKTKETHEILVLNGCDYQ